MKKTFLLIFLIFTFLFNLNADDLGILLQDLAIQTACLGKYSSAEAGLRDNITNRFIDPPDYYTPSLMATRFANMSGSMTRTITFYGVCFDYAQFAWDDIKKYQSSYNNAGMKDQQWFIAVTSPGDPNNIYLYDPVTPERATTTLNGIPVRENSRHRVRAHDDATGHAWLWVQHKNGTWYWIDPTWTDNTGYPWWGIVQNGKEVQYYPNPAFAVASKYPKPPTPTERETRSHDSTYVTYSPTSHSVAGYSFGYISAFDFNKKFGFSLEVHECLPYEESGITASYYFDYLRNSSESEPRNSLLLGVTFGYQFFYSFVLYAGGGIGLNYPFDNGVFSWKVNGGLRINIKWVFLKFDVSYNQTIGSAFGFGFGIIP